MRRLTPSLVLLGLVLVGCGGPGPDTTIDPSLHQATIEVTGMS
jgi:hypothetical protein